MIPLACGLGLGNRERVKCQVQSHKTGTNAHDTRMLLFSEGEVNAPSIYAPQSLEEVCLDQCKAGGLLLSLNHLFFPSRCCLGTPEKWVDDVVILHKPNIVIKENLGAFNYQRISILQMGKRHFTYHSRGLGKEGLFLPRIKRILWHRELIVLQYIFIREIIG